MPVFRLTDKLVFPHPSLADEDGILAVEETFRASVSSLHIKTEYFPGFRKTSLYYGGPESQVCSFPKRHKNIEVYEKIFKENSSTKSPFDTCFRHVIAMCAKLREGNTWITPEIIESYSKLHDLGFAHSVETWYEVALSEDFMVSL